MKLHKNIHFLKIFSIANLLFLASILSFGITHFYKSFDFVVFTVTLLFLIVAPILYAFSIYPNINSKAVVFIEMIFGVIFTYQVIWYFVFPFTPILLVLKKSEILSSSLIMQRGSLAVALLVFCSIATFFTFKYFYKLRLKITKG